MLNFLSFALIIIINEIHRFSWIAYVSMFGLGFMDNSTNCFQNTISGFQFESKIVPFAEIAFTKDFTVFLITFVLIVLNNHTKEDYRLLFIVVLLQKTYVFK